VWHIALAQDRVQFWALLLSELNFKGVYEVQKKSSQILASFTGFRLQIQLAKVG